MKLPWKKAPSGRRRTVPAWRKRVSVILNSEETYVFGGLGLVSLGAAMIAGALFGTWIGVGTGLASFGAGSFGVGMWMLTPAKVAE